MQIVDAQIHIWGTGLPNNKAHIQQTSFTAEQAIFLMDEAGVDLDHNSSTKLGPRIAPTGSHAG